MKVSKICKDALLLIAIAERPPNKYIAKHLNGTGLRGCVKLIQDDALATNQSSHKHILSSQTAYAMNRAASLH